MFKWFPEPSKKSQDITIFLGPSLNKSTVGRGDIHQTLPFLGPLPKTKHLKQISKKPPYNKTQKNILKTKAKKQTYKKKQVGRTGRFFPRSTAPLLLDRTISRGFPARPSPWSPRRRAWPRSAAWLLPGFFQPTSSTSSKTPHHPSVW